MGQRLIRLQWGSGLSAYKGVSGLSANAQLQQVGKVDQCNPRAQEFLEAYDALRQDFDVWVGQIAFADALELQAMWNNREIWPRRLARLPGIEPPRQDEEQEPTPELPPMEKGMGKGKFMAQPPPVQPKGKGKGAASWNFSELVSMYGAPPAAPAGQRARPSPPPIHGLARAGAVAVLPPSPERHVNTLI